MLKRLQNFNPTIVLLKQPLPLFSSVQLLDFNPTIVLLKPTDDATKISSFMANFNPTIVLLKRTGIEKGALLILTFQSYNSSIKTPPKIRLNKAYKRKFLTFVIVKGR